jgi:MscS family membrane protein
MAPKAAWRCAEPTRRARRALAATLALLALGAAPGALAQQDPAPEGEAEEGLLRVDRATPRGSVLGYLLASRAGDFQEAAGYLNLAPVPQPKRARRGPELARQLKIVLDQTLWIDLESLSSEPAGQLDDGLPPQRDRVGVIETQHGPVDVFVDRVRRDAARVWEISPITVARIPMLYEEFGYGPLGNWLPSVLFESQILNIQLWQWTGLLLLVLLAYVVSWVVVRTLIGALRRLAARSATQIDDRLVAALAGPLRLSAALLLFAMGLYSLNLSLPAQRFFVSLEKALAIAVGTWFVLRIVDIFGGIVETRLEEREPQAASGLVPLGRKTIKFVVGGLALLAALDSFGFDVTALIAGLGVGGLAVALAAQKTLENLFGGATLLADRPVRVGDFCRFGDKLGIVEEIGLRSTRIRTLARTVVTVPNAEFSSLQLENFAARDKIWFNPRIGLRYETTPDQLRYVLVEVRRMLYAHPKVDPDPARVRFVGFGDFSLDLDIYAYVLAVDFSEYLEIAEDLNLRIMDIVEQSGTGFAFPSNTTYLAKDDGVNEEKSREAERNVARWREERELYLPGFPAEKVSDLAGTLPYPAKGSPDGEA